MADKDTPEDAGTPGEPVQLPDGPPSEGGPATRPTEPVADDAPAEAADGATAPAPPVSTPTVPDIAADEALPEVVPPPAEPPRQETPPTDADDPWPETLAEALVEPPSSSEEAPTPPEPDSPETAAAEAPSEVAPPPPPEELPPQDIPTPEADGPRTKAVAQALAEPQAPPPEAPDPPPVPTAEVHAAEDEPSPVAPEPVAEAHPPPPVIVESPAPEPAAYDAPAPPPPDDPAADDRLPADPAPPDAAPPAPPAPEPSSDSASFTTAADDLFRPAELGPADDPHMITLGRRLNPALAIPRPVPPVIGPETLPAPAAPAAVWKSRLLTGARYAAYAVAGYLALVLVLIVLFRFVNPPGSMLMLTKLLGGTAVDRTWMPLGSISPALVRAVIVSEDSRFCAHRGIDMQAMRQALQEAGRGSPRGASTISMQVTKNLFLWNAKSYLRKVVEIPLTLAMEVVWPKRRIVEVYLNVAEWGPGVFGAEAAARHHFQKAAAKLNEREAALLAAALPNPMIRVASAPGPRTSRMARVIQARVKAFGSVASCVVAAPPPASAAPAAARPRAPAVRKPQPAPKKTAPQKQQKQPNPNTTDWAPTLRFGP